MIEFIKKLFGGKPAEQTAEAPYKVETAPAPDVETAPTPIPVAETPVEPAKCGCGRSQTGFCVGLHKLSTDEWASHPDNPIKPVAVVEQAPAKQPAKKPAPKKQQPAKKPVAPKPKAPRKPKAKPAV
jgi:monoamine oxidase